MSPATSEAQRRLFCLALSIKEGKTEASLSKEGARIASENSIETLTEFCKSPVKK